MLRRSLLLFMCAAALQAQNKGLTALDRYVAKPDPAYKWELVKTIPSNGVTAYVLNMTSQNWLTAAEVNRTEWKHWVTVYKPDVVESDVALLMITGGNNENNAPDKIEPFSASIAAKTKSVTVELKMVPNQPLSFFGESRKRTEDAMIAFSWKKFMETGDGRWPAGSWSSPGHCTCGRGRTSSTSCCARGRRCRSRPRGGCCSRPVATPGATGPPARSSASGPRCSPSCWRGACCG